jgi:hypothetical protein
VGASTNCRITDFPFSLTLSTNTRVHVSRGNITHKQGMSKVVPEPSGMEHLLARADKAGCSVARSRRLVVVIARSCSGGEIPGRALVRRLFQTVAGDEKAVNRGWTSHAHGPETSRRGGTMVRPFWE